MASMVFVLGTFVPATCDATPYHHWSTWTCDLCGTKLGNVGTPRGWLCVGKSQHLCRQCRESVTDALNVEEDDA